MLSSKMINGRSDGYCIDNYRVSFSKSKTKIKYMKKITLCMTAIVLSLTFSPATSNAEAPAGSDTSVSVTTEEMAKTNAMMLRLYEIQAMDKSTLTRSEVKSLRKEVRTLDKEMKAVNNGVYLSVGAIIIIILLLILIV